MQEHSIRTDDSLMETKHHGTSIFPLAFYHENIYKYDFHTVDWHWHHELQFEFAEKGTIICKIGSERFLLKEGYGLLLNSGVIHRFEAEEDAYESSMVFAPELFGAEDTLIYRKYLQPFMQNGPAYLLLEPNVPWQNQILEKLRYIYVNFRDPASGQPTGCELRFMSEMFAMMDLIFRDAALYKDQTGLSPDFRQVRLQQMMQYIHEHYSEDLSLEQIAESAAIGKSSAIAIFNSGINETPVHYLTQYRLKRAADLLNSTRKTLAVIAAETGFSEAGYFCRKFREIYHMTPGEYRKERKHPQAT